MIMDSGCMLINQMYSNMKEKQNWALNGVSNFVFPDAEIQKNVKEDKTLCCVPSYLTRVASKMTFLIKLIAFHFNKGCLVILKS
jgi:hypothetical protein